MTKHERRQTKEQLLLTIGFSAVVYTALRWIGTSEMFNSGTAQIARIAVGMTICGTFGFWTREILDRLTRTQPQGNDDDRRR